MNNYFIPKQLNRVKTQAGRENSNLPDTPPCVYTHNPDSANFPKTQQQKERRKFRSNTKSEKPTFSSKDIMKVAGRILKGKKRKKGTNEYEDYRVCVCGRMLIPDNKVTGESARAKIYEHEESKHRVIGGVIKCTSVWLCADCASKITEGRRQEVKKFIAKVEKDGDTVLMATFTFSHHLGTSLKSMLQSAAKAKSNSKSGAKFQNFKELYNLIGTIDALEITYSDRNGFHPHYHELYAFKGKLTNDIISDIATLLREIWEKQAERQGLTMNEHGFHLETTRDAIEEYIAKWGHMPSDPDKLWSLAEEMVKGHMKQSRSEKGYTPFAILHAIKYLEMQEQTEEVIKAKEHFEKVFIEYAEATLGKHQIHWSKGLKKLYEIEELTDEELVNQFTEHCNLIAAILPIAWGIVLTNVLIEDILTMDMFEMKLLLCSLGASPQDILLYKPEDRERWKKHEATLALEKGLDIPESETNKIFDDLPIDKVTKVLYSKEPTDQEKELLEHLQAYNVIFSQKPCTCGCKIARLALGEIVCSNCDPSPLWSNQTRKKLKVISLDRKRASNKEKRISL